MRTNTRPRRLVMAAGGLAVFLVTAAAAWACSGQSTLFILDSPPIASASTHLIVHGQLVSSPDSAPAPSSAEIRWNSADGPSLAQVVPSQTGYQAQVQLPEVAPGVYYMLLVAGGKPMARLAVQVVPAAGQGTRSLASVSKGTWSASSSGYQPAASIKGHGVEGQLGLALLAIGLVGVSVTGTMLATMRRRATRR